MISAQLHAAVGQLPRYGQLRTEYDTRLDRAGVTMPADKPEAVIPTRIS